MICPDKRMSGHITFRPVNATLRSPGQRTWKARKNHAEDIRQELREIGEHNAVDGGAITQAKTIALFQENQPGGKSSTHTISGILMRMRSWIVALQP